jgi:hypothetical protein
MNVGDYGGGSGRDGYGSDHSLAHVKTHSSGKARKHMAKSKSKTSRPESHDTLRELAARYGGHATSRHIFPPNPIPLHDDSLHQHLDPSLSLQGYIQSAPDVSSLGSMTNLQYGMPSFSTAQYNQLTDGQQYGHGAQQSNSFASTHGYYNDAMGYGKPDEAQLTSQALLGQNQMQDGMFDQSTAYGMSFDQNEDYNYGLPSAQYSSYPLDKYGHGSTYSGGDDTSSSSSFYSYDAGIPLLDGNMSGTPLPHQRLPSQTYTGQALPPQAQLDQAQPPRSRTGGPALPPVPFRSHPSLNLALLEELNEDAEDYDDLLDDTKSSTADEAILPMRNAPGVVYPTLHGLYSQKQIDRWKRDLHTASYWEIPHELTDRASEFLAERRGVVYSTIQRTVPKKMDWAMVCNVLSGEEGRVQAALRALYGSPSQPWMYLIIKKNDRKKVARRVAQALNLKYLTHGYGYMKRRFISPEDGAKILTATDEEIADMDRNWPVLTEIEQAQRERILRDRARNKSSRIVRARKGES